jgi:hypothetical protein
MKIGKLGVGDRWNRWVSGAGVSPVRIETLLPVIRATPFSLTAEKAPCPIGLVTVLMNFGRLGGLDEVGPRAAAGQSKNTGLGYSPSPSCPRPAAAGSSGTGAPPVRIQTLQRFDHAAQISSIAEKATRHLIGFATALLNFGSPGRRMDATGSADAIPISPSARLAISWMPAFPFCRTAYFYAHLQKPLCL